MKNSNSFYNLFYISMRVCIIILMCIVLSHTAKAQIGFNCTNTNDKLDPITRGYIVEMAGDDFWYVFRNDKYTTAAPQQDIDNVLALANDLQAAGKELKIIYTFNARNEVTIEQNFFAYNQLKPYIHVSRIVLVLLVVVSFSFFFVVFIFITHIAYAYKIIYF